VLDADLDAFVHHLVGGARLRRDHNRINAAGVIDPRS
jgi:hypothetical protein